MNLGTIEFESELETTRKPEVILDRLEELILALESNVLDVRKRAAIDLGDLKDVRAVESLILALNDADREVRCEAVVALGKIGDPRLIEPMGETYHGAGPSYRIDIPVIDSRSATEKDIQFVARAILQIGPPAVEVLIDIVEKKGGNDFRYPANAYICWQVALLAPWMSRDTLAAETIHKLLQHNDASVRERFAEFLKERVERRATDLLIEAINDTNWKVRKTKALSLGYKTGTDVEKALIKALTDENS
jgi:HEAT repeat protein